MFEKIKLGFPFAQTFLSYKKSYLYKDIFAGLTVSAVAVPQSMAYAQLAGVSLATGLYAALVAMVVYALFSATRRVIMGPDAALAALAGAAVLPIAGGDAGRSIVLVAFLSILIGVFSLISVFLRLSVVAEFISRPILLGYMGGLAIIVSISQIPKLIGIDVPQLPNTLDMLNSILQNLWLAHTPTVVISITALSIGVILSRTFVRLPVSLILLVFATLLSWHFDLSVYGIATLGAVELTLPKLNWGIIGASDVQNLVIPALAMMLVAYANTIATARSFAVRSREHTNPDQEFFGLGLSNLITGLSGGMPVSASGVRTSLNYKNSAHSQFSQIFGAIGIGVVLLVFLSYLQYLPLSVLAVIVIMAVSSLFNFVELRSIWHAWRSEAILAVVTTLGVVVLGIYQGLLLAVLLAIMNILRKSAFPNDAVLGVTATGAVRDMHRPPKTSEIPGLKMYRFDAPLYFGNANFFRSRVLSLIKDSKHPVQWFLWDAETITALDSTSGAMLVELIAELKSQGVVFAVARMKGSIRQIVHHTHKLNRALQRTPHFPSLGEAIEAFYRDERSK